MQTEFDEVFEIMDESFPDEEMRTYEGQKALLKENEYRVFVKRDEKGQMLAFMTLWEFDEFSYVEHLATTQRARGRGIGSEIVKDYMKSTENPVILEVEPGDTELAKRRIGFYKRLGFHLNPYPYEQPALRVDTLPCRLEIMSYPRAITQQEFSHYVDILYQRVYRDPHKAK